MGDLFSPLRGARLKLKLISLGRIIRQVLSVASPSEREAAASSSAVFN